jgi:hypothetical protein
MSNTRTDSRKCINSDGWPETTIAVTIGSASDVHPYMVEVDPMIVDQNALPWLDSKPLTFMIRLMIMTMMMMMITPFSRVHIP